VENRFISSLVLSSTKQSIKYCYHLCSLRWFWISSLLLWLQYLQLRILVWFLLPLYRETNQVEPRTYIGVGHISRFRRNLLSLVVAWHCTCVYTTPGIALGPPGVIFLTDTAMQCTHILWTQYPLPTQPCSALISYSCSISYRRSHAVRTSINPQHNLHDARVQFTSWQNVVFTACDVHTMPWSAFKSQATDTV
jgi:hypothetical protein